LRKEFLQAIDIPDYSKRKGISLMIGGADPENIALRISGILLNGKPGCQINVISNDINNPDFLSLSEKFPQRIKVYKNLEAGKIASIFQTSRIGIFPASTSAFEAIACRLPFIVGYFVDNQIDNYRGFIEKKLASGIGDLNTVDAKTILETVETLETDTVLYESIMKNQAMAFDGLSSERLRKIFISL
jgi:spore coat polysaccharide biosynthesis predicted glycosyltransferase SpsG